MQSKIYFKPLDAHHLPFLRKWLEEPHVKEFYDPDVVWTKASVQNKFEPYIQGVKILHGFKKTIHSFILYLEHQPIGYAQYYNAYDFPRDGYDLAETLGHSQVQDGNLAAMDIFIGKKEWIGQGIGSIAIQKLLQEFVWKHFTVCLADPDPKNKQAIRAYEKAGFLQGPAHLMFCHKTAQIPTFIRTGVYGVATEGHKLLVVQQKQGVHRGKFDLPGGGIDPGESIEEALKREFLEEVGMQFDSMKPLCNLTAATYNIEKTMRLHQIGLIYQVDGLCSVEHQKIELEYKWLDWGELKTSMLTPFLQDVLPRTFH